MKKLALILFITFCFIGGNLYAQETNYSATPENITIHKESGYLIISNDKFKEIYAAMNKQDDWSPILLEGFSKEELVAFYIQSYDDEWIEKYMDWAYGKIHNFASIKPDSQQERKLQKAKLNPNTRENAFLFMMLLTTEQIEVLGY